jgi:MFS family permease
LALEVNVDPRTAGRAWAWPESARAWYAVTILSLVSMMSNIDRGVINLLISPIKRDLHLSDTAISLLVGATFSVVYVVFSFPLARVADVKSRKVILTLGLAVWSLATMLCGLAQTLWQLFLARGLVGAGESVKGPCSMSMITDLVPEQKLPRAFAIFQLGITGGMAAAMVVGGFLLALFAHMPPLTLPGNIVVREWHMVFLVTGSPGLLLALVMAFTVREPVRQDRKTKGSVPLKEVVRFLFLNKGLYLPLFLSIAIAATENYGLQSWRPSFLERTYGWGPAQAGPLLGGMLLIATPIGLWLGTLLAEHLHRRRPEDAMVRSCLWSQLIATPFAILMPLMPTPWLALGVGLLGSIAWSMTAPGQNAAILTVTPNEMRGQVSAIYLFCISVVGGGFGPTAIALITDHVFHDEAMLRYSMAGFAAVVGPVIIFLIWKAMGCYASAYDRKGGRQAAA